MHGLLTTSLVVRAYLAMRPVSIPLNIDAAIVETFDDLHVTMSTVHESEIAKLMYSTLTVPSMLDEFESSSIANNEEWDPNLVPQPLFSSRASKAKRYFVCPNMIPKPLFHKDSEREDSLSESQTASSRRSSVQSTSSIFSRSSDLSLMQTPLTNPNMTPIKPAECASTCRSPGTPNTPTTHINKLQKPRPSKKDSDTRNNSSNSFATTNLSEDMKQCNSIIDHLRWRFGDTLFQGNLERKVLPSSLSQDRLRAVALDKFPQNAGQLGYDTEPEIELTVEDIVAAKKSCLQAIVPAPHLAFIAMDSEVPLSERELDMLNQYKKFQDDRIRVKRSASTDILGAVKIQKRPDSAGEFSTTRNDSLTSSGFASSDESFSRTQWPPRTSSHRLKAAPVGQDLAERSRQSLIDETDKLFLRYKTSYHNTLCPDMEEWKPPTPPKTQTSVERVSPATGLQPATNTPLASVASTARTKDTPVSTTGNSLSRQPSLNLSRRNSQQLSSPSRTNSLKRLWSDARRTSAFHISLLGPASRSVTEPVLSKPYSALPSVNASAASLGQVCDEIGGGGGQGSVEVPAEVKKERRKGFVMRNLGFGKG